MKALRLQQIHSRESANEFLDHIDLEKLNHPFHVTARSPAHLHRALPRGMNLPHVLCHQEERVVHNDWTVSWCNRICQWNVVPQSRSLSQKKILVSELLDGTLRLTSGTQTLSGTEVSTRPLKPKPKPPHPFQSSLRTSPPPTTRGVEDSEATQRKFRGRPPEITM